MDHYLTELTPGQALLALQRAADVMLNGGHYEPVGHKGADTLLIDLMAMSQAHVRSLVADTPDLCYARGPRIGGAGRPVCKRERGHPGRCQPAAEDGWGSIVWPAPATN